MVAELAAAGVALIVVAAEALHARRCRRLARLAFGPGQKPAAWARLAPAARVAASAAVAWGLVTLLSLPPRVHVAEEIPDHLRRNLLLVLDVSPSMRLADAGPERKASRMKRASEVMESFFERVPIDQYLTTVVACYNGAKPVVVRTKDLEVVRNILGELPMHQAFPSGQTDLFAGIREAAKLAAPWNPRSTILLLVTDGDTVPATGMPKLPASIADVLVVGIGDPRTGSFIDGRQSRQDASTLRQVAVRLGGTYHDGNEKHLPSDLLRQLTLMPKESLLDRLSVREYALLAVGLGSAVLALLPVGLHWLGSRWRPGVAVTRTGHELRSRLPSLTEFGVPTSVGAG